jgi:UDP-N-acetylmuramoyl-tripeptide--D-alanyl-D-alanine ligase
MRFFYHTIMSLSELYTIFLTHPAIVIDSRKAVQGSIFFALKGEQTDGNKFAARALENGCAYAVVDNREYAVSEKCILVEDTLQTLQALALHHRKQFDIPFIAITGTNGKTTTKELVTQVLSTKYKVHATAGNHNNHIGVPLTLLSIPGHCELAVIEMGANHPGEIEQLCNIALPTHGLITNVGLAHLEGFGSLEGVIQAKTELYRFIDSNNGVLFVHSAQEELVQHAALCRCKKLFYGSRKDDFCIGQFTGVDPYLTFSLNTRNENSSVSKMSVRTRLIGKYNLNNALAAACVGMFFRCDSEQIRQSLEGYVPGNQRSQLMKTANNLLILDNYNANPSSMKAALENFCEFPHSNKVLILGDMLELGPQANAEHKSILGWVDPSGAKTVYLVGELFKKAASGKAYHFFLNSDLLADYLKAHPLKDAAILIKGSRGIKLEKIIEYL